MENLNQVLVTALLEIVHSTTMYWITFWNCYYSLHQTYCAQVAQTVGGPWWENHI